MPLWQDLVVLVLSVIRNEFTILDILNKRNLGLPSTLQKFQQLRRGQVTKRYAI
jgi:hypothetical protein